MGVLPLLVALLVLPAMLHVVLVLLLLLLQLLLLMTLRPELGGPTPGAYESWTAIPPELERPCCECHRTKSLPRACHCAMLGTTNVWHSRPILLETMIDLLCDV